MSSSINSASVRLRILPKCFPENYTSLQFIMLFSSSLNFSGSKLVMAKKFSSSGFWHDCRNYKVTVIMYIGKQETFTSLLFRYVMHYFIVCLEYW